MIHFQFDLYLLEIHVNYPFIHIFHGHLDPDVFSTLNELTGFQKNKTEDNKLNLHLVIYQIKLFRSIILPVISC